MALLRWLGTPGPRRTLLAFAVTFLAALAVFTLPRFVWTSASLARAEVTGAPTQFSVRVFNTSGASQTVTVTFQTSPNNFGIGIPFSAIAVPGNPRVVTIGAHGYAEVVLDWTPVSSGHYCIAVKIESAGYPPIYTYRNLDVTEDLKPGVTWWYRIRAINFGRGEMRPVLIGAVPVDGVPDERWCELFEAVAERPVLWQAWEQVVRAMAAAPGRAVPAIVSDLALGSPPDRWQERVAGAVAEAARRRYGPGADRLFRFSMGLAMRGLRGRVPALEVADAVRTEVASR